MSIPPSTWDASLIELFRSEVETHSESLNAALLALERTPGDTSRIDEMMRAAHSIKGASRVVGVEPAVHVAHAMEDYFVSAQKGAIQFRSSDVDVLLRGVDLLGNISAATRDPEVNLSQVFDTDVQTLVSELREVLAGNTAATEPHLAVPHSAAAASASTAATEVTLLFPTILDVIAAEELRQQFLQAIDSPCQVIRFDLTGTQDLDVPGLAFLAAAPRHLAEHSQALLCLAGVSSELALVLRVTGLDAQYGTSPLSMPGDQ